MATVTKEEIKAQIEEKNIRFLRLMFTDILGTVKNVEVPMGQIDKVLDEKMMFDGSSIEGFVRISESDMYLVPDLDTWLVFPWDIDVNSKKPARVARLICDVYNPDMTPFSGDPRGNLKRILKKAEDMGFTDFNLGPEPEFFLFKMNNTGGITDRLNDHGGYFDLAPSDLAENCRRDIVIELEELGFEIEASHHEAAPGQHEIDWKYASAVEACDNIQTFKLIVKTVARKHGLHATFMPKPSHGIHGSGMHMNMSLFSGEENAFYDKNNERGLSDVAYEFLAGLIKHAKGYTAITNPIVNSYKRLVPSFEAPVHIAWSGSNRTPMIRVPTSRGKSTRLEVRSVDPSTNPYLALASLLQAGLSGVKDNLAIPTPKDTNVFEFDETELEVEGIDMLPNNLHFAIEELKKDKTIQSALGEHIYSKFIELKQHEWQEYSEVITDWEKNKYMKEY